MSERFKVIQTDDNGDPLRCSCCARDVPALAMLPLLDRPLGSPDDVLRDDTGNARWLGFCLACLRSMAGELEVFGEPAGAKN